MYAFEPVIYSGQRPSKAHEDDAAFDLKAAFCTDSFFDGQWRIDSGEWRLIQTDTRIAIPDGHVGIVAGRSGLALKRGLVLANGIGVIDPGYRGEIGVILLNLGGGRAVIRPGDRIAQLLILPNSNFKMVEGRIDSNTERGENGFGSTGTRQRLKKVDL